MNTLYAEPPAKKSKKEAPAPPSEAQIARQEHFEATGNANPVVPFGITLLAPGWTDGYVAGVAAAYEKATGLAAGPIGHKVQPYRTIGTVRLRKSSIGVKH